MKVIDKSTGKIYKSIEAAYRDGCYHEHVRTVQKKIKKNGHYDSIYPYISGNMETESTSAKNAPVHRIHEVYTEEELDDLVKLKEIKADTEIYKLSPSTSNKSRRAAVALLSDCHIGERIEKASVLGLNEYNPKEAKRRLENFFTRLVKMMRRNPADELHLGIIGDLINGWLRSEAEQENFMAPLEEIAFIKPILISGIQHLLDNLSVDKITVIGCVGNHSRLSHKLQVANNHKVNLEYFLLKQIEEVFADNEKISFIIPQSEACIVTILGKRMLFCHGSSLKGGTGISGPHPILARWFHKMNNTFNISMAFVGHLHNLLYTDNVVVNGSCCGWNSFAMSHGFPFQDPMQAFLVLDEKHGRRVMAPIYLK